MCERFGTHSYIHAIFFRLFAVAFSTSNGCALLTCILVLNLFWFFYKYIVFWIQLIPPLFSMVIACFLLRFNFTVSDSLFSFFFCGSCSRCASCLHEAHFLSYCLSGFTCVSAVQFGQLLWFIHSAGGIFSKCRFLKNWMFSLLLLFSL